MDIPRRSLLAGFAGVIACAPGAGPQSRTPAPDPSLGTTEPTPDPWVPELGAWAPATFPTGVRAGDPTPTGVLLAGACTVDEIQVLAAAFTDGRWAELPVQGPFPVVDGHARVDLQGLAPETLHTFRFGTTDGAGFSEACTGPTPADEDRDPVVRIGASCCFGKKNRRLPTLGVAAGLQLDAFVIHGDAIYTQATTLEGYRDKYGVLLGVSSFRALAQTTPLIAVWDDHEVANDWNPNDIEASQLRDATTAFQEVLPQRGMWRSLRFGRTLELVLLDTRGERGADQLVSAEQLDWAIDTLLNSPCQFKVVVTSVHMTDHGLRIASNPDDPIDVPFRWQGHPAQRAALVAAAEAAGGVVFVTGDMHFGGLQRVGASGDAGALLWEVAAGPAGSNPWDVAMWLADTNADVEQYDLLLTTWNSVVITADPEVGTLQVKWFDDDGQILAERQLIEG